MPSIMRMVEGAFWICRIRAKGASFCHVERISPVVRSRPCRTSGSQVCIGASPTLSANASITIVAGMGWVIC